MAIYQLDERLAFPDPAEADRTGILAIGGDLRPERLILAYQQGIFPWYNEEEPIIWWSPNPRMVLYPEDLKISKSMKQVLRRKTFTVSFDKDFRAVVRACQQQPRKGQGGTWITDEMLEAYVELHELGYAHSVEAWKAGKLAGGLYGISLGKYFCGESMFSKVSNASKTALIYLTKALKGKGFKMIDCQVYTRHLASMGATKISRERFLKELSSCLEQKTLMGNWEKRFDVSGLEF